MPQGKLQTKLERMEINAEIVKCIRQGIKHTFTLDGIQTVGLLVGWAQPRAQGWFHPRAYSNSSDHSGCDTHQQHSSVYQGMPHAGVRAATAVVYSVLMRQL